MDPAIARAPIQICNVNPKQPTDLFCKKKKKKKKYWNQCFGQS